MKPNDQRNVNLMNYCAKKLFEDFKHDILCAYGFSDEFSFALHRESLLFERKFK